MTLLNSNQFPTTNPLSFYQDDIVYDLHYHLNLDYDLDNLVHTEDELNIGYIGDNGEIMMLSWVDSIITLTNFPNHIIEEIKTKLS